MDAPPLGPWTPAAAKSTAQNDEQQEERRIKLRNYQQVRYRGKIFLDDDCVMMEDEECKGVMSYCLAHGRHPWLLMVTCSRAYHGLASLNKPEV